MDKMFAEQMERELEGIASLSERQMEQFYQYYEMLVEWNQVMNLTAITEMTEVVTKHFVDSLSLKKAHGQYFFLSIAQIVNRFLQRDFIQPITVVIIVAYLVHDIDGVPAVGIDWFVQGNRVDDCF